MEKLEEVGVVESNLVDVASTNKTEGAETAMWRFPSTNSNLTQYYCIIMLFFNLFTLTNKLLPCYKIWCVQANTIISTNLALEAKARYSDLHCYNTKDTVPWLLMKPIPSLLIMMNWAPWWICLNHSTFVDANFAQD